MGVGESRGSRYKIRGQNQGTKLERTKTPLQNRKHFLPLLRNFDPLANMFFFIRSRHHRNSTYMSGSICFIYSWLGRVSSTNTATNMTKCPYVQKKKIAHEKPNAMAGMIRAGRTRTLCLHGQKIVGRAKIGPVQNTLGRDKIWRRRERYWKKDGGVHRLSGLDTRYPFFIILTVSGHTSSVEVHSPKSRWHRPLGGSSCRDSPFFPRFLDVGEWRI